MKIKSNHLIPVNFEFKKYDTDYVLKTRAKKMSNYNQSLWLTGQANR